MATKVLDMFLHDRPTGSWKSFCNLPWRVVGPNGWVVMTPANTWVRDDTNTKWLPIACTGGTPVDPPPPDPPVNERNEIVLVYSSVPLPANSVGLVDRVNVLSFPWVWIHNGIPHGDCYGWPCDSTKPLYSEPVDPELGPSGGGVPVDIFFEMASWLGGHYDDEHNADCIFHTVRFNPTKWRTDYYLKGVRRSAVTDEPVHPLFSSVNSAPRVVINPDSWTLVASQPGLLHPACGTVAGGPLFWLEALDNIESPGSIGSQDKFEIYVKIRVCDLENSIVYTNGTNDGVSWQLAYSELPPRQLTHLGGTRTLLGDWYDYEDPVVKINLKTVELYTGAP